jgi:hypothetical protein
LGLSFRILQQCIKAKFLCFLSSSLNSAHALAICIFQCTHEFEVVKGRHKRHIIYLEGIDVPCHQLSNHSGFYSES